MKRLTMIVASLLSLSCYISYVKAETNPVWPGTEPTCPKLSVLFNDVGGQTSRYGRTFICKSLSFPVENFEQYIVCERGNGVQFKIARQLSAGQWWLLEQEVDIPMTSLVIDPDYNNCGIFVKRGK